MNYDVIIIGAGASGLTAAIAAARQGSSVLVLERKDKAGKKILATGNGKCNFANLVQKPECYRSDDSTFPMKVLSLFDVNQTLEFFKELGILPKNRDGYLYPNSEQAASVVSVLLMECERLKVDIRYNETVVELRKPDFTVVTEVIDSDTADKKKNSPADPNYFPADQKKIPTGSKNNSAGLKNNPADLKKNPAKDVIISKTKNKNQGKADLNKPSNRPGNIAGNIARNLAGSENTPSIERIYNGRTLILATGGCASPQLGSDGSGYRLAKSFGHTLIKPLPALVQLKSPDKYCKTVSGVRTLARAAAYTGKLQIAAEEGEILFTDYGISGIPILQISRFVAKALDQGEKVHLLLDLLPEVTVEDLTELLQHRISQNPGKNTEEMMVGLLNHKLSYILLKEANLDVYKKASQLTKQEIAGLVKQIKEFKMLLSETNSFENAQVSAGGVSTKEIDSATLESKLVNNLYLVGELVDVEGTCGGYNLQWAWSSGYLAGTAAGKK